MPQQGNHSKQSLSLLKGLQMSDRSNPCYGLQKAIELDRQPKLKAAFMDEGSLDISDKFKLFRFLGRR